MAPFSPTTQRRWWGCDRAITLERVIAGIRRAQAAGTHCGRPKVELDLRPAISMLEDGYGLKAISKSLKVSRATLRRRLEEAGQWPPNK